jgi:hypothetical protein
MANETQEKDSPTRPERIKLTAEESLKRMKEFETRKARSVAAARTQAESNLPSDRRPQQEHAMEDTSNVLRYENVQFHFLGADEDSYLPGTVLRRTADMVLEIPGGYGPYHIVGRANGHAFCGTNDHPDREYEVEARWADVGSHFVGIWIEGGYEYLFSFELNAAS